MPRVPHRAASLTRSPVDVARPPVVAAPMLHAPLALVACIILALSLVGCGGDTPDPGASGSSSGDAGDGKGAICSDGGTSLAGEACVTDCDCCGRACAVLTDDAGSRRVCASGCPAR